MKTVYLCGAIAGCNDEEMHGWRNSFAKLWPGVVLDPTVRDYRETFITDEIAQQIVEEDLKDIRQCDALVMHFENPSVGSSMEVFYAKFVLDIPVVVISQKTNLSPWLIHHCDWIAEDIDEAISFLRGKFGTCDHAHTYVGMTHNDEIYQCRECGEIEYR